MVDMVDRAIKKIEEIKVTVELELTAIAAVNDKNVQNINENI